MALYKQAEFAAKCGIERAYLSMYKKRGKVIVDDSGMIDDSNPINIQFKAHCEERALLKGKSPAKEPEAPVQAKVKASKPKKEKPTKAESDLHLKAGKKLELDSAKKSMEIVKLEQDVILTKMKNEKMLGRIVPTDIVKNLFAQHFRSVTVAFKQAADIITVEFGKKAKMNRNDMAEMKGALIRAINKAVEDSVHESKKNLDQLIVEYAKKK